MRNLTIIASTNFDDIARAIPETGAHFTNGTYAYPVELILPTTLAGFEYVHQSRSLPMVVAINSDESMRALGKKDFEPQLVRARKVAVPLAKKFTSTQIIIIFYDETTPFELYRALSRAGKTMSLHKWGYGTTPDAPKIEGAEFFRWVYAFPLLNDIKPVCWKETTAQDRAHPNIKVVDLRLKKPIEDFDLASLTPMTQEGLEKLFESRGIKTFERAVVSVDDSTLQQTVELGDCRVEFVDAMGHKLTNYRDLPEFTINQDERSIIEASEEAIRKNGDFDGNHILIKNLNFRSGVLSIEACRTSYAVVRVLDQLKRDKIYYKTGALAPMVAETGEVFLLERKNKMYSSPAGFIQPTAQVHAESLSAFWEEQARARSVDQSFQPLEKTMSDGRQIDWIRLTAMAEAAQELLHQDSVEKRPSKFKLGNMTMSIRHTRGLPAIRTIEFFVPIRLDKTAEQIREMISANTAPDAKEHTGQYREVNRASVKSFFDNPPPGWFLYFPVLCQRVPELMRAYQDYVQIRSAPVAQP